MTAYYFLTSDPRCTGLFVRRIKQNVAIDADIELVTDRNFDCWLDAQIFSCDLRSGLADFLTNGTCRDLRRTRILARLYCVYVECHAQRTECAATPSGTDSGFLRYRNSRVEDQSPAGTAYELEDAESEVHDVYYRPVKTL